MCSDDGAIDKTKFPTAQIMHDLFEEGRDKKKQKNISPQNSRSELNIMAMPFVCVCVCVPLVSLLSITALFLFQHVTFPFCSASESVAFDESALPPCQSGAFREVPTRPSFREKHGRAVPKIDRSHHPISHSICLCNLVLGFFFSLFVYFLYSPFVYRVTGGSPLDT